MKNLAFIFIVILGTAISSAAQSANNQVETIYRQGIESASKAGSTTDIDKNIGYLETAIKHFTEALKIEPRNIKVLLERAKTHKTLFEHEKALADCETALEFASQNAQPVPLELYKIYRMKGDIYEHADDYKNAVANYQMALKYKPNDSEVTNSINQMRILEGDETVSDAEVEQSLSSAFGDLLKLNPPKNIKQRMQKGLSPKPDNFYYLGLANLKKANTAKTAKLVYRFCNSAYDNFSKSIEINPNFAESYFQRARANFDEVDETCTGAVNVDDLDTAISFKPDFVEAYLLRADAWNSDDFENRLADLSRAIELKPADVSILLRRGKVYLEQYEFEKALADSEQALRKLQSGKSKNPTKIAAVYVFTGTIYTTGFYFEKAIEAYTTALKFDARNAEIYQSRANVYQYVGETAKADADFTKAENLMKIGKFSYPPADTGGTVISGKASVIEYPEKFQIIGFQEVSGYEEAIVSKDLDKDGEISDEEFRKAHITHLLKLNKLVNFNPKSDLALWKRGDFYLQLNELSNQLFWISAESDFANAFDLNPRCEYLINRGVVRAKRDNKTNYEFAVRHFSDAVQINNKSVEAFYNRGLSYLKLNENEKAIADFTEVIKLDPKFILAYKSRARAFRAVGKTAEAQADEKTFKTLTGQ